MGHTPQRFKGVRQRHWGSWVSEIRHPLLKTRVWLGTYASAEEAARAYDEAARLMSGTNAKTNFAFDPNAPLTHCTRFPPSLVAKLQASTTCSTTTTTAPAAAAATSSSSFDVDSMAIAPSSLSHGAHYYSPSSPAFIDISQTKDCNYSTDRSCNLQLHNPRYSVNTADSCQASPFSWASSNSNGKSSCGTFGCSGRRPYSAKFPQSITCLRLDPEKSNLGLWQKKGGIDSKSNWVMTLMQLDHDDLFVGNAPAASGSMNSAAAATDGGRNKLQRRRRRRRHRRDRDYFEIDDAITLIGPTSATKLQCVGDNNGGHRFHTLSSAVGVDPPQPHECPMTEFRLLKARDHHHAGSSAAPAVTAAVVAAPKANLEGGNVVAPQMSCPATAAATDAEVHHGILGDDSYGSQTNSTPKAGADAADAMACDDDGFLTRRRDDTAQTKHVDDGGGRARGGTVAIAASASQNEIVVGDCGGFPGSPVAALAIASPGVHHQDDDVSDGGGGFQTNPAAAAKDISIVAAEVHHQNVNDEGGAGAAGGFQQSTRNAAAAAAAAEVHRMGADGHAYRVRSKRSPSAAAAEPNSIAMCEEDEEEEPRPQSSYSGYYKEGEVEYEDAMLKQMIRELLNMNSASSAPTLQLRSPASSYSAGAALDSSITTATCTHGSVFSSDSSCCHLHQASRSCSSSNYCSSSSPSDTVYSSAAAFFKYYNCPLAADATATARSSSSREQSPLFDDAAHTYTDYWYTYMADTIDLLS